MGYDAHATRARLITAAVEEFSAHGLAGGRVDRIAASAGANKRAIYDYFGDKEGLFDAALSRVTDDLIEAVPLRDGDLVAYAGTLFDYLLAHPEAQRMLGWRRLQRPQGAPRLAAAFVAQLGEPGGGDAPGARSARRRSVTGIGPADLAVLVIGLANAWDLSGPDIVRARDDDPDDPARADAHRAAVVEAARRLATP